MRALIESMSNAVLREASETFAGKVRVPISKEEYAAFNKRVREAGFSGKCCGLAKTRDGFSAHTYRARSKWVKHPSEFTVDELRWIESTG